MKARRGPPKRRGSLKIGKQSGWRVFEPKEGLDPIEDTGWGL
jgi:hypothetical protein